jgi:radical SAM protein with 4Fe4S-binding SPASM domain
MVQEYLEEIKINNLPRLPLEGSIDLTYRCNNDCRHCWLRIPADSSDKNKELSFGEIRKIVDVAKNMGCRKWSISGGEPMLRPDFPEIFDYLTHNSSSCSINTNGTLITPKIARALKRKGTKMVALYGATAQVHDHITRNPGSFEAVMRGFAYLKEAGAGFIVQLIPMKDNYHQFKDMIKLAEFLSKHYRIGAPWLYLSVCGSAERNKEIMRQRLPPKEVVELDKPDLSYEDWMKEENPGCHNTNEKGYLFSSCIKSRRDFHIDPYGKMTFCSFIKDPTLRYDIKKGSFKEAWEEFIPSLASKVKVTPEYQKNCGSCELRKDCRFCPVYGYLEHGKFDAKVNYLCAVAKENKKFKEEWLKEHRRYFRIADMTIQVESDLVFNESTFHPKFRHFEVAGPSKDTIRLRHHFSLPDLEGKGLGKELYCKAPWAIYKKEDSWIYLGIILHQGVKRVYKVAVFNSGHTRARIYNDKEEAFLKGNLCSLTLFPTDQILLARVLADRQGCYLHSCGVNFKGRGLLFAGHSDAGKSTIATMFKGKAEILCDDRIIIRRWPQGFKIYGTWSHGDVADVSSNSAPLRAVLFLNKATENKLVPLTDKKQIVRRLLACLIKPFVTVDWWENTLLLIDKISGEITCYELYFDKSGRIIDKLKKLQ